MTDDEKNTARQQEPENAKKADITPFLKANKKEVQPETIDADLENYLQETMSAAAASTQTTAAIMERQTALYRAAGQVNNAIQQAITFFGTPEWMQTQERIKAMLAEPERLIRILQELDELDKLFPYLEDVLKMDEYKSLSLDNITLSEFQAAYTGNIDESDPEARLLAAAIQTAVAAKEKADNTEKVTVKRADKLDMPLDKINAKVWNLLQQTGNTSGQLTASFNLAKKGSPIELNAIYAIDFSDLHDVTITKQLTPFDKWVYYAVNALFSTGLTTFSMTQIYYAMGNASKPSRKQIEKIHTSIQKMTTARIYLDNKQEADAYKTRQHFSYNGSLLPIESVEVNINGQIAEAAIHIFREPPLITFARQRRQITTLPVKLLQSPINKTDASLALQSYLLERISKAKNGTSTSHRIRYSTIYENVKISGKKQEARAKDKIRILLDYYSKNGFIKRYTQEEDGVTIYWSKASSRN